MPSYFQLNDFIASVKAGGLSRINRFEVVIQSPDNNQEQNFLTSLHCEITDFAAMQIQLKPYRIFGPSQPMPINAEYGGAQFPMTFIMDRDMMIKRYFDTWMHQVVAPGYFHLNYPAAYRRDIFIRQLNEGLNGEIPVEAPGAGDGHTGVTYEMKLVEAFPFVMNPMALDYGSKDTIHRLTVGFAFRYWETTEGPDVAGSIIQHLDPSGSAFPVIGVPGAYYGTVGTGVGPIAPTPTTLPVG